LLQFADLSGIVSIWREPFNETDKMALKQVTAAGLLLILGACTNLTAVSNFATLGSSVTSSTAAIDSYPKATQESARMAPPADAATRQQQAAQAPGETEVADLGMKTLSLYFSTLARLSDGKLVDVTSSASSIGTSLKSLSVVDATISSPATSLITLLLTAPLDTWRNEAVAHLINNANQSVQTLGIALANFADTTANMYDTDISQADIFYRGLGASSHDPAIREMLDEWRVQNINSYTAARDQASAAATSLRKLVQGQADLKAHKDELTSAELKALLTQCETDILSAAKLF
jgi:hypothetical protein